jgi:hypothetical protein
VGGQRHALAVYPWKRDQVPIVRDGGYAPGSVWTDAENLAPPEFEPQITQPVASPYTDYAIPAHVLVKCPIFLSHINIFGYSRQMVLKVSLSNFTNIHPVGDEFVYIHACGQTGGRTDGPASSNRNKLSVRVPTRLKKTLHFALCQDQFKTFMDPVRNKFAGPNNA